ncbi:recombinase family protein [SAR92 clade bacterium H921]|nr:recombinase family protein [SAR92 clade bacterium H921]
MKYIAYYRVSTVKQGQSGLGLEAQKAAVVDYLKSNAGELVTEYTEIQSGSKDNRPELQAALRQCRLTGATLLIAKLDRLSRNRSFLMNVQDSSVQFVAVDMPEANHFTVGLMACLADYERQLISERTTAALKAAKARGVVLGNPRLDEVRNTDTTKARAARVISAKQRNAEMLDIINEMRDESDIDLSLRDLTKMLNDAGYKTSRGKKWHPTSVMRVLRV